MDRRQGTDRRSIARRNTKVEIEWEGAVGRQRGTISNISENGCFVMSSGAVWDGEIVKLFIPLNLGRKVQFFGEVTNHEVEIGFAVRFIELSEAQTDFLEKLVDTLAP
ncbi:MAG: PilZ domain-containing protein [Pyrinomonadaceae bacterium]|nr:PilZ domain-containing protein [Pyrinomonadaceae bacterium]